MICWYNSTWRWLFEKYSLWQARWIANCRKNEGVVMRYVCVPTISSLWSLWTNHIFSQQNTVWFVDRHGGHALTDEEKHEFTISVVNYSSTCSNTSLDLLDV